MPYVHQVTLFHFSPPDLLTQQSKIFIDLCIPQLYLPVDFLSIGFTMYFIYGAYVDLISRITDII